MKNYKLYRLQLNKTEKFIGAGTIPELFRLVKVLYKRERLDIPFDWYKLDFIIRK